MIRRTDPSTLTTLQNSESVLTIQLFLLMKLNTWLGRVIRDLKRKVSRPDACLEERLSLCDRLHAHEKAGRKQLYSLHEAGVMCISHGKADRRYKFGQEVSVT